MLTAVSGGTSRHTPWQRQEADYNIPSRGRNHHQTNTPSKKAGRTQSTALSDSNRPPSCLRTGHCCLLQHMSQCRLGLAHTEDCPCQAGPRSPEYVLQFCPSSEKQEHGSGPMEQRYRNSCGAAWRTIVFIQTTWLLEAEPCSNSEIEDALH